MDKHIIYAWFWIRNIAIFIDCIVTVVINTVLWFVVGFVLWHFLWLSDFFIIKQISFLVSLLVWVSYFGLFHYFWWQTIWKMIMWIKVVNKNNFWKLSFIQSIFRFIAPILILLIPWLIIWFFLNLINYSSESLFFQFFISVITIIPFLLNYLWPSWDNEKRAIHDMLSRTRVIEINKIKSWIVIVINVLISLITIIYIIFIINNMINIMQNPDILNTINAVN